MDIDKNILLLDKCIISWKEKVASLSKSPSTVVKYDSCALCVEFTLSNKTANCEGCCIYETSGVHYCNGTPFVKVMTLRYNSMSVLPAVKDMLVYLENLRVKLTSEVSDNG